MNPLNHFGIKKQFIRGDTTSYNKQVTCSHCGQVIGVEDMDHDSYDLMKSHAYSCNSKAARALRRSLDDER